MNKWKILLCWTIAFGMFLLIATIPFWLGGKGSEIVSYVSFAGVLILKIVDFFTLPRITFVGVLIAILTLLEIRKRRLKSYEPNLFFPNMTLYLQKNSNGTPCILKTETKKYDDYSSGPFFSIDIHNIGLGAANTISIKWVYNQRKIIKKFEELGNQTKLLRTENEGYFKYLFGDETDDGYGFTISSTEEEEKEISFLTAKQSTKTRMPDALCNYLTFIPYLELINQNNPRKIVLNIDDFKVLCTYFDTGGKKHEQTINLSIRVYVYSEEFFENNYGIGTITFRK